MNAKIRAAFRRIWAFCPFPRAFPVRRCGKESSRSCRARRPRGPGSNAHVFRKFGRIRSNARPPHVGAGVLDGPAGTGKIRIILGESAKTPVKAYADSPEWFRMGSPCCGTSRTPSPTKECCEFARRSSCGKTLLRNVGDDVPYKALFLCVNGNGEADRPKKSNSPCRGRRPRRPGRDGQDTHHLGRIRKTPVKASADSPECFRVGRPCCGTSRTPSRTILREPYAETKEHPCRKAAHEMHEEKDKCPHTEDICPFLRINRPPVRSLTPSGSAGCRCPRW